MDKTIITDNEKSIIVNGDNNGIINIISKNSPLSLKDSLYDQMMDVINDIFCKKPVTRKGHKIFWCFIELTSYDDDEIDSDTAEKFKWYLIKSLRIKTMLDYKVCYFMFKSAYDSYIAKKEIWDNRLDDIYNFVKREDFRLYKGYADFLEEEIRNFVFKQAIAKEIISAAAKQEQIQGLEGVKADDKFYLKKMDDNGFIYKNFEILLNSEFGRRSFYQENF
ncbi:hypothetical protein [Campylobacter sp. RM16188]|uniref:hypothetical protein n=1 Tax=Campylobacter sp. RM16188 TaxID=1705725 RepID=UPI0015559DF6|nr:hypothetical protein [Campylobacter sp. RM16188]